MRKKKQGRSGDPLGHKAAGKMGGNITKYKYLTNDPDYYKNIGRKGGLANKGKTAWNKGLKEGHARV